MMRILKIASLKKKLTQELPPKEIHGINKNLKKKNVGNRLKQYTFLKFQNRHI